MYTQTYHYIMFYVIYVKSLYHMLRYNKIKTIFTFLNYVELHKQINKLKS